ncbi:TPX2 (targeting protein for Xklp2) proteinfamily [Striga asiatica]|uniref:TPX2 (Targeting protein for Xklp2) proteinfamily n=1 Tax=Striga asiatica TaxID=4170 RepID=A0A5A7QQE8_STRAF|nr:TPX2 (targeting protein for Xklp2) proteinfamily [Striga asiatica]
MGESTCLLHGFSYASAIPNESKQGNAMHALGESISFGRFMTESLSWEKWSSFSSSTSSHKKYVEEAERYARPGSVAQKKAFFEAHYKRMAAQKAAALLEQQNAAAGAAKTELYEDRNVHDHQQKGGILDSQLDFVEKNEDVKVEDVREDKVDWNNHMDEDRVCKEGENVINAEIEGSGESPVERRISVSGSEISGTPLMELPLLKSNSAVTEEVQSAESKKKSSLASLKSSIRRKTWKIPSTPARPPVTTNTTPQFKKDISQSTRKSNVDTTDKKRNSTKSLRELISLVPVKEPDKQPSLATIKGVSLIKTPKICRTPIRTPAVGTSKAVTKDSAYTPLTERRRMKTPIDSSAACGSKTMGPKWHILSALSKSVTACRNKLQSPSLSTPFTLRTEERATKRKQKLEEKFNANAVQKKVEQQNKLKDKAGSELRKLSCTFCFKARPLPSFYKEREISVSQTRKTQTAVLGRSISNKKKNQGTISMPPPPPPPKYTVKNGFSKKLSKNKVAANGHKCPNPSLTIARENKSPNIVH